MLWPVTSWNLTLQVCETRKFVMAVLHWKQGLLCDKELSSSVLQFWQKKLLLQRSVPQGHIVYLHTTWLKVPVTWDWCWYYQPVSICYSTCSPVSVVLQTSLLLCRLSCYRYLLHRWELLFNPFPHNDTFWCPWETNLLKTLWEKEKLLVTSNFSFSHSVFYLFG